jgi:hypothetical protein
MSKYKEMLTIPIEDGSNIPLYLNAPHFAISKGYNRVVIGQRGPYVEFNKNQIICNALYIPCSQLYRLSDPKVYYIEFRTTDCDVKVYYQMRSVAYADYKIGYFYISPSDLYKVDGSSCMILPDDYTETAKEFFDFESK